MGIKTYLNAVLSLAFVPVVIPAQASTMGECSSVLSNEEIFNCFVDTKSYTYKADKLIHALDTKFSELPSCEDIDQQLKLFLTSVRSLREQQKDSGYLSDALISNTVRKDVNPNLNQSTLSAADIFKIRFNISPVAKEYYYSFLEAIETANGSSNRPVFSLGFDTNKSKAYSKSSTVSSNGIAVNKSKTYTYMTDPTLSLEYEILSLQNLFATKALRETQKSAYFTFVDQAVVDSLSTVSDFYDFKANVLSTLIYSAQYQAAIERVDRLKRLQAEGLNSVLDVSRANVTAITQSSSLLDSKSLLAQSYQKLLGDFLFNQSSYSDISLSPDRIEAACWSTPPSISIERALETNSSLNSIRHSIKSSRFTKTSILSGNLPEISLGVSYSTDNKWGNINGSGFNGDYSQTQDAVASATVNWNIFDFGQTLANAKAQEFSTYSLESQLLESASQLESDLLVYFTQYVTNTSNLMKLANGSSKATANYLNTLKGSQTGFLTQTDVDNVFDQLTSLNQDLLENIKGRNNAAVNIAKLVQSEGFKDLNFDQFLQDWKNTFPK